MKVLTNIIAILFSITTLGQQVFKADNTEILFVSDAPLELISVRSSACVGVLNLETNKFAFRVRVQSFEGFNSPLQREHFNENYMESNKFPNATFIGRIVDEVDLTKPEKSQVKVKGDFNIHDVNMERIIYLDLFVNEDNAIEFECDFVVKLEDHEINVPRIVYQKIAETIKVSVTGILQ